MIRKDVYMLVSCIGFMAGAVMLGPFRDPVRDVVRMLGWFLNMVSLICIWELWNERANKR